MAKKDIREIKLGDQVEREMAVMFCDIRDFTTLSEQMSPRDNFEFLNGYMGRMTAPVLENGGIIDKYIGDAIMALFPAVTNQAIDAALQMQRILAEYNKGRVEAGRPEVRAGIGIHVGTLMLGTIGSRERMDSTVISDAVNVASRIEGLTKKYNAQIMVSESVIEKLPEQSKYNHKRLDSVLVKGKSQQLNVYEITDKTS